MPDPTRIRVYYEGSDDGAVLRGLQSCGLISIELEIATRDPAQSFGREGLVKDVAAFVGPVAGSAIALVDFDDHTIDELADWFRRELEGAIRPHLAAASVTTQQSDNPRVRLITVSSPLQGGRVTLVAAGLPGDQHIRGTFGIESFAIDDHVLKVACDARVFAGVNDFREISHALALKKLGEIIALLRSNGLELRQSKRMLHIIRAMTGFRASSATFIDRLIRESLKAIGKDQVAALMHPLTENIQQAATMLAT